LNEELKHLKETEAPSEEIVIDGVGSIKIYGDFDIEKLVKRLLESKSITG
jgi:hypothetical protein